MLRRKFDMRVSLTDANLIMHNIDFNTRVRARSEAPPRNSRGRARNSYSDSDAPTLRVFLRTPCITAPDVLVPPRSGPPAQATIEPDELLEAIRRASARSPVRPA
jgi:hypothetical protein